MNRSVIIFIDCLGIVLCIVLAVFLSVSNHGMEYPWFGDRIPSVLDTCSDPPVCSVVFAGYRYWRVETELRLSGVLEQTIAYGSGDGVNWHLVGPVGFPPRVVSRVGLTTLTYTP